MLLPQNKIEEDLQQLEEKQKEKTLCPWRKTFLLPDLWRSPAAVSLGPIQKLLMPLSPLFAYQKNPEILSLWKISFSNMRPLRNLKGLCLSSLCRSFPSINDSLLYESRCQQLQ